MGTTVDSYATNWIRVADRESLNQLVAHFASQSESCPGGENWHIEDGLGESVRVSAHDLADGDLSIQKQNGVSIRFEEALLGLLENDEVLVFQTLSWQDGKPHFSARVYANNDHVEITSIDIVRQASERLRFSPEKVVL